MLNDLLLWYVTSVTFYRGMLQVWPFTVVCYKSDLLLWYVTSV